MYAPQISEKNTVKVPDFATSTNAQYARIGNDLIIKAFGETHRIADFFKSVPPPILKTTSGETIDLSQIDIIYPPMNVQVADNNVISAADVPNVIGKVSLVVEGPAKAVNDGKERTLNVNDPVYLHDTISTGSKTYLKITLKDGTVFQLGPQSKASLETYDFDPATVGGKFESNIFMGIFRFISGAIADKNEGTHTILKTPSATIGIRGSEIDGQVDEDGNTTVLHSTGVIEVRSNYHLENITIYKPHTKIEIPNTPVENSHSEVVNNESAQQIRNFLSPLNQQSPDSSHNPQGIHNNSTNPPNPQAAQPKTGSEGKGDVHDLPPPPHQQGFVTERDVPSSTRGKSTTDLPPLNGQPDLQRHNENQEGSFIPSPPLNGNNTRPLEQEKNTNDNPQTGSKEPPPSPPVEGKFTVLEDHPLILPTKGMISNLKQPENGTVELKEDTLVYTPHKNFFGIDTFYLHSSELGDVNIEVNILPVEDSLIAANYKAFILEDTPFSLKTEELLKLAYNPDIKEPLDLTKLSVIRIASSMEFDPNLGDLTHGKLELNQNNSEILFFPEMNYNGKVYFAYQVAQKTNDGQQLLSPPAFIEIEIQAVNDLPIAKESLSFNIKAGQLLEIKQDVLLAVMHDIDGDKLSITRVDFPSQGNWSIVDNASLKASFTNDLGGQSLSFTYYVSDGSGVDVPIEAKVQIEAQPVIPIQILQAIPDALITPTNTVLQISTTNLLENDIIPTEVIANISAVQNPLHGTVELVNDQIIFMPDKDFNGLAEFEYVVEDDAGNQDIGTVTIDVQLTGHFIELPQASTLLQYTVSFPAVNVDNQAFISNMAFAPAGETRYLRIEASGLSTGEQLNISNNGAATILTATPTLIILSFDGAVGQSALESLIKSVSYNAFMGSTMPTAGTKTISFSLYDDQAAAESGGAELDSVSRSINLTLPQIAADDIVDASVNTPFLIPADQLFANDSGIGLKIIGLANLSDGVQAQLYGNDVAVYVDGNMAQSALGFDYQVQTLSGATGSAHVTLNPTNIQTATEGDDVLTGNPLQNNVIYGLDGNDTLTGDTGNDLIDGGAGNDIIDGGNGFDQLIGGLGNDTFLFNPNNGIVNISGGAGEDVLKLNTTGAYLDLIANQSAPAGQNMQLSGIDRIDLGAGNVLTLSANDVLSLSDNGQLIVDGGAGSSVTSAGQGWTNAGLIALGGINYTDYSMGSAHLLINQNISTQFIF